DGDRTAGDTRSEADAASARESRHWWCLGLVAHRRIKSKERLRLLIEPILAADTWVLLRHDAAWPDEPGNRHGDIGAVRLEHVIVAEPDEHRIVHLLLSGELLQLGGFVIDRNPEDRELPALVLVRELDQRRNFFLAGPAPGRPEVDDERASFVRRELHVAAVH